MISYAGRAVLQRVRRGIILRCAVLGAALAGLVLLFGWLVVTGRDPFAGPWLVVGVLLGFWIVMLARAPLDLIAVNADLASGEVERLSGRAEKLRIRAPGLVSPDRAAILIAGRRFPADKALYESVVTGDAVDAVIARRSGVLVDLQPAAGAPPANLHPDLDLTRRQARLLALIGEGLTDKEIARALNLAPATVRAYNSELYARLGVANRTQAARFARPGGD